MQTGDASSVYQRMEQDRDPFLDRARQCARFTIPHLQPEYDQEPGMRGQKMPEPWQSFGARAANNLISKLTLTILPLNAKFFRLAVDEASLQNLEALENARVEVEQDLAQIEDMVIDKIEQSGLRTKVGEALAFNEVSGNALVHVPATRPPRVYRMDSFGLERDPRGNLMQIVIRERVSPMVLEQRVKRRLTGLGVDMADQSKRWVEVFTRLKRDTDGEGGFIWKEWQEVNGKVLAKITTHKFERNPYIHVRGGTVDGESYGRSHCEQYLGDLRALDALSKYLQQGTAQAAKTIWGISKTAPPGTIRKLTKAKNGGYIPGVEEGSVWPISLANKSADFATVRAEIQDLKRDLGMAFLMNSTVPRNAERVTAEEIRLVASELDDTLGGTFSLLSSDLQLPLVNIILGNMQESGEIDELPKQVRPVIVTGLDAIGRGHDLARLDTFLGGAIQILGPEVLNSINVNVYMQLRGLAAGVQQLDQLIKSDEQLAQEQQAAQAQEAAMKLGPQLLKDAPPEAIAEAAQQLGGAQAS